MKSSAGDGSRRPCIERRALDPGLKPSIGEAISRGYGKASIEAARETGLDEDQFSKMCPYTWHDIVSRGFPL
jgi:Domain of unknown function DUF29